MNFYQYIDFFYMNNSCFYEFMKKLPINKKGA